MFNDYHFITRWRVQGRWPKCTRFLAIRLQPVRWWPAVYLDVKQTHPGDAQASARSACTQRLVSHTLRRLGICLPLRAVPTAFLDARGDFVGQGVWTFTRDGEFVDIVYDWRVVADNRSCARSRSPWKPIFAKNHEWAMRMGEQSLRLELARRKCPDKGRSKTRFRRRRRRKHHDEPAFVRRLAAAITVLWGRSCCARC